ncbi:MAG: Gfo/Idh/MocA family oxidoreductase [Phycisphaerae bacterium]|nr:Gfo/Idh/MocA family oxidoreductase [Phycisphaerae bacterium]
MDKMKIGVVGLGGAANHYHLPCLTRFEDVEVYLCDAWEEPLRNTRAKWDIPEERTFRDLSEMLRQVDPSCVFVLLPQYTRDGRPPTPYEEYVATVLRAGKAIFVEKPLGVNGDQARRLVSMANSSDVRTTMCGFQRRFNPLLRYALKRIHDRGPLLQCSFSFFKGMVRKEHCEEAAFTGYNWLTLDLVHCLDLARWTPRAELVDFHSSKRVYPTQNKLFSEFHAMATFNNGVTSFFSGNVRAGGRILRFELHGHGISAFLTSEPNDGTVPKEESTSHHDMVAHIFTTDGTRPYGPLPEPEIVHSYDVSPVPTQQGLAGWWDQARHFVDCARDGKSTDSSFEDACKTIELCDLILMT